MNVRLRPRNARGHFQHGWLDTYHTFSFGHYVDPQWHQFHTLRVMNEDIVAPGEGFGMHGHSDMEILTWVLDGELEHRDSLGHGATLRPGEMQWMSAGTGIRHSEYNPSTTKPTHLYQIWLFPDRKGHTPTYDQREFPQAGRHNQFQVLAAADGRDGALPIRQDAVVSVAALDPGAALEQGLHADRQAWVQVLRGKVQVDEQLLSAGDGVGLSGLSRLTLQSKTPSEVMLFDLA